MTIEVRLASPSDTNAVLALFDRAGVSCHCRYWHFEGTKNDWLERCAFSSSKNADELAAALRTKNRSEGTALLALEGEVVRGWAKLFPKDAAHKLLRQGPYKSYCHTYTSDVWCIGCVLVDPQSRHRGIARALTLGLPAAGQALGAIALEAYPRVGHGPVADEELWMGIAAHLEDAGFAAIAGESPYPVYALTLPTNSRNETPPPPPPQGS